MKHHGPERVDKHSPAAGAAYRELVARARRVGIERRHVLEHQVLHEGYRVEGVRRSRLRGPGLHHGSIVLASPLAQARPPAPIPESPTSPQKRTETRRDAPS